MSGAITPVKSLWTSLEANKASMSKVLPPHLTIERFYYQLWMALQKTPKLGNCTPGSVLESVRTAADLGLDCSGSLGSAWLIPYGETCQLIIGYRGLIDLACRSGFVSTVNGWVIRERDQWEAPLAGKLPKHRPFFPMPDDEQQDPGRVIGAWARMKLNSLGDNTECEVMTVRQLDAIKARSASVRGGRKDSPWFTDEDQMQVKTVIRRLLKKAPLSPLRDVTPRQAAYQEKFTKALEIDDADFTATPEEAPKPKTTKTEEMKKKVSTPATEMSDAEKQAAIDAEFKSEGKP